MTNLIGCMVILVFSFTGGEKMKRVILLLLLVLCISYAQSDEDEEYADIDFENITIEEFIEEVSEIVGKEILMENEIKGAIHFVATQPILKSELIPLANAILETKELTLVNKGAYYSVIKSSTAIFCGVEDIFPKRGIPKTDT